MRLTVWLTFGLLAASGLQAKPSLPPLVEEGERLEDVEEVLDLVGSSSYTIAFSPNGATLASASLDSTVRLWDLASGREIQRLEGHGDVVSSLAFSPDGATLASASSDRTIRLWDLASGSESQKLEGQGLLVLSVAFSPDGATLASASEDRTVRLWELASGSERQRFEGHWDTVSSVAFSPDGATLASASSDRTIRLWDLASGSERQRLEGHRDTVSSVAFRPDGVTLASASFDSTIRLWEVSSGKEIQRLVGQGPLVLFVAFSPDGTTLASASGDSTVRLWDLVSGRETQRLEGHQSWVRSVAFSPDGATLASASGDSTARLWDLASGREIQRLEGQGSWVRSIAFSPDGATLASAPGDSTVRLWNLASGREIQRLEGHGDAVSSVAFSPDGATLASASFDRTVRLWNLASGKEVQRLKGHRATVSSVVFSPDGETLASASSDRIIKLWKLASGEESQRLEGHGDAVRSVAFSPDGANLASASLDSTVRLWELASRREIQRLEGHQSEVFSVAFSPDGAILASASADSTVRLWEVASGKEIHRLDGHRSGVLSVAFSPDGATLASSSFRIRLGRRAEGFRTFREFLVGQHGAWVGCQLDTKICWRHDDGTLLMRQTGDGRLYPIPPQISLTEPGLKILEAPGELETSDGGTTDFTLKVRNTGTHRAFWVGIRQVSGEENPAHGLGLPPTRGFLEPGAIAELEAWVSTRSIQSGPRPRTSILQLEITSLHGEPLAVPPIEIRGRAPALDWQSAAWDPLRRVLTAELLNSGDQALPAVELIARLSDLAEPLAVVSHKEPLPAGISMSVDFEVPIGYEPNQTTLLTLDVRQPSRPGHRWTFEDQPLYRPLPWTLLAVITGLVLILGTGRLFLHPLVRQLSSRPASLHELPIAELPRARRLLTLTGRLGSVLAKAGVERTLLDQATRYLLNPDPDTRVQRIAERLGARVENGSDHELRLLRLGTNFPLNLDRCLIHLPPAHRPSADVLTRLRARNETRDQITLILAPDPARQEELFRVAGDGATTLQVVPSTSQITAFLLASSPAEVLAQILASQVRRTRLSPYQTGGGVKKSTIFFGRDELLAHVLNREPSNYLVVGGRQLGKSSLLKAIDRHYRDDPNIQCHSLTLADSDLVGSLARTVGLPRDTELDEVARFLGDRKKRSLVLIDEADAFVQIESAKSPILARLRSLSEEGRCHFILAGFWDLYAAVVLDYQSPLKNFGETLRIGALEDDACRQLATVPMANLGLHWSSDDLVDRLLRETGRRANLIAIACHEILNVIDLKQRELSAEHLDRVLEGTAIDDALEGWRGLGSVASDDSRLDRILIYATIGRDEGFTHGEVLRLLEELGHPADPESVRRSLQRLELAYVLGRSNPESAADRKVGRFTYQVPLFVRRIREQGPEVLLEQELRAIGPEGND